MAELKPGDLVAATFAATTFAPGRTREQVIAGATVHMVELWDRAPVERTPSGYVDPWWCLAPDKSEWFITATRRKGSRGGPERIYVNAHLLYNTCARPARVA